MPVWQNESVAVEEVSGVTRISHHVPPEGYSDGCHANRTPVFISMESVASSCLRADDAYPGWPPPNCWHKFAMSKWNVRKTRSWSLDGCWKSIFLHIERSVSHFEIRLVRNCFTILWSFLYKICRQSKLYISRHNFIFIWKQTTD
jgi:hypothetical protein